MSITVCDDCNRSTSGSCWRHPQTITLPVSDPSKEAAAKVVLELVLTYKDEWEEGPATFDRHMDIPLAEDIYNILAPAFGLARSDA